MKRFWLHCGVLALAVSLSSCTWLGMFEDVGSDPHPPLVEIVGVAYTPVPLPVEVETTEGATETDTTVTTTPELPPPVFKPADGFEIKSNDPQTTSLVMRVRYEDAGGDITNFWLRDRDGVFSVTGTPAPPEIDLNNDGLPDEIDASDFFSGTSGTVDLVDIAFDSKMLGAHRMELWAEDSHGSRSPKVAFTFIVVLAER